MFLPSHFLPHSYYANGVNTFISLASKRHNFALANDILHLTILFEITMGKKFEKKEGKIQLAAVN